MLYAADHNPWKLEKKLKTWRIEMWIADLLIMIAASDVCWGIKIISKGSRQI
jgi:hypothetical protein